LATFVSAARSVPNCAGRTVSSPICARFIPLEGFTCQIEEVIAADDNAAARMTFYGRHRGRFFGIESSGREIRWSGAAFFKTREGKIIELWVLGDIEEIRRQLEPQRAAAIFQL